MTSGQDPIRQDVPPDAARPAHRMIYLILGHVALAAGLVALIVPVVPTTPFLVLAAFLYDRSSRRFHHWLVNHRWLGPPIRKWQARPGLTARDKTILTLITFVVMGAYIHFVLPPGWLRIATALIGAAWLWFILLIVPTRRLNS